MIQAQLIREPPFGNLREVLLGKNPPDALRGVPPELIFAFDCISVKGNTNIETLFLLYCLRFIQAHILRKATGFVQPQVYPDYIKNLFYAVPDDSTIKKFGETIIPINEQWENCFSKNIELVKLRDFLLPMLMSGQERKNEAKEQLSMAVEPQVKFGR